MGNLGIFFLITPHKVGENDYYTMIEYTKI